MSDETKKDAEKMVYQKALGLFAKIPDELPQADANSLEKDDPAAEYQRLAKISQTDIDEGNRKSRRDFEAFAKPIKSRLKMLGLPHADLTQIINDFEEAGYNAEGVSFEEIVDRVCATVEPMLAEKFRTVLAKRYVDGGAKEYPKPDLEPRDAFIWQNIRKKSMIELIQALKVKKNFGMKKAITTPKGFKDAALRYSQHYKKPTRNFLSETPYMPSDTD